MALVAAQVSARAVLPAFMRFVPAARADGLSAHIGRPPSWSVAAATAIAAGALVISLGLTGAVVGLLLLSCAGLFTGWLSVKH
jgi:adenosylcobinamide-GDP ribazoletransferase